MTLKKHHFARVRHSNKVYLFVPQLPATIKRDGTYNYYVQGGCQGCAFVNYPRGQDGDCRQQHLIAERANIDCMQGEGSIYIRPDKWDEYLTECVTRRLEG